MFLIVIGLLIWTGAHLLRSLAPELRQSMQNSMGGGAKGLMGAIILLSLVLMIVGYRGVEFVPVWSPPLWMRPINNLLMVLAIYIYFTTATKPGTTFVFSSVKNPQLTGFKIWAFAHLLVNGDLASIILFGGLLAWAVVQVIASKRAVSLVDRNTAPIDSPWAHLALVVLVFAIIVFAHSWLGVSPFSV